jgi:hypothetical protein
MIHPKIENIDNINSVFKANILLYFFDGGKLMSFILLLLIFIAVIILLLFAIDFKLKFEIDSSKECINMNCLWLYPLLKVSININENNQLMKFYLFGKRIYEKPVKKKHTHKYSSKEIINIVNLKNICIAISYGFINPSSTGIICGAVNMASQFINIESISQNPDFWAENDYIYINATATVNVGTAFISLIKQKIKRRNLAWIRPQT